MFKKKLFIFLSLSITFSSINCKKNNPKEELSINKETPLGFYNIDFNSIFTYKDSHSDIDNIIINKLNEYYNIVWQNKNLSGGILVARGNNILFEKYQGYANITSKKEITSSTPLHVASVSKIMTSLVILKLIENNKINLEQKVNTILPSFPYSDITIKDLLTHRSGLANYEYFTEDSKIWKKNKTLSNQDILNILIQNKLNLQSVPGTHFAYCNTNFALLALVIEKITGNPYPQVMENMVFKPLQMKNTFVYQTKDSLRATPSYYAQGKIFPLNYLDQVYGDKNTYSTPQDLFKLSQAMFAPNFLSKDLLDKMFTPYSNEKNGVKNYGLGIRMMVFENGKKLIYHTGWWHGNNAIFIHLLDEKVTIIALGNKYSSAIYSAIKLSSLFGNYPMNLDEFEQHETVSTQSVKNSGNKNQS